MQKATKVLAVIMLGVLTVVGSTFAEVYTIDPAHSEIGFAVRHLTVSTTKGGFTDFSGTVKFDPDNLLGASAEAVIKVASVNTHVEARDNHLRSADFFDAEKFSEITFKSASIEKNDGGYVIKGDLTIKGVAKSIAIPCSISGPVMSPFGMQVIGLAGQATINRQEFGVSWNKTLDTGGLVVSDDVLITVNIEANKKPDASQEAAPKEVEKK